MGRPSDFAWTEQGDGSVVVTHHGKRAAVLRGRTATDFLESVEAGADPQELLARLTGNYKRGNERTARNHPRNR